MVKLVSWKKRLRVADGTAFTLKNLTKPSISRLITLESKTNMKQIRIQIFIIHLGSQHQSVVMERLQRDEILLHHQDQLEAVNNNNLSIRILHLKRIVLPKEVTEVPSIHRSVLNQIILHHRDLVTEIPTVHTVRNQVFLHHRDLVKMEVVVILLKIKIPKDLIKQESKEPLNLDLDLLMITINTDLSRLLEPPLLVKRNVTRETHTNPMVRPMEVNYIQDHGVDGSITIQLAGVKPTSNAATLGVKVVLRAEGAVPALLITRIRKESAAQVAAAETVSIRAVVVRMVGRCTVDLVEARIIWPTAGTRCT